MSTWEEELGNDPDRSFIIDGIKNGFDIIDPSPEVSPVSCRNHPSALPNSALHKKATEQVRKEIECGNYVLCQTPPKIVSPMAAIPKPDGDVRLIHDCSRPTGKSVNDYCTEDWEIKFARVDDAANLMTNGCYYGKVDLRKAYRSVKLSDQSQQVTGLCWDFNGQNVYLKDTRLPFGARLSVGIFHRLTKAVKRIMASKGYDLLIVYLDDFLIITDSQESCAEALSVLIQLFRKLGFSIHWGKWWTLCSGSLSLVWN